MLHNNVLSLRAKMIKLLKTVKNFNKIVVASD
jgi:hypothetical protein